MQFKLTKYSEVVLNLKWCFTMNQELDALESNDTWILTTLLIRKRALDSKWVGPIKYKTNGTLERYKTHLIVQGNTGSRFH